MPFLSTWLLWAPPLNRRLFLGGDFVEHIGARGYVYRELAQGRLPLWDPLRETGLPFLSYLFDVFNPALLVFPFLLEGGFLRNDTMQLVMVAHLALGGLGAYLWGLSLNLGRTASCLMGLVWGLNGFILIKATGHDLVIHTLAWVPYIFLFLDRARRKASALSSAWAGFFLALLFMGGHPQFFFYISLALAAHFIYWASVFISVRGGGKAVPVLVRMYLPLGLAALFIAAPQIGHFLGQAMGGLQGVSPSGDWTDLIFSQRASAQVRGLFYFLLPRLAEGGSESLVYVGIIPLIFGILALYYLKGREVGFWKLVLMLGMVLMMGGSTGLHKVLVDLIPGYALFRESRRWVVLCHLALTVLAGYFTAWLLARNPAPPVGRAAGGAGALGGVMLLGLVSAVILQRTGLYKTGFSLEPVMNSFTAALILSGATWLVLKRAAAGQRSRGLRMFLVAVVAIDLGFFQLPMTLYNFKEIPPDPSKVTAGMKEDAANLARLAGGQPWRFAISSHALHQSARYQAGVMRTGEMPPHVERLMPLGYWQIHWQPTANPRYSDLLSVRYLREGSPRLKAVRSSWQVAGFSQAGCRLAKGVKVESLLIRAKAEFTAGVKQGALLAWLGLVREGKLAASWPLRWGREITSDRIELTLAKPTPADELIMASANSRALVDFQEIWVNGKRASDRMAFRKAGRGLVENLNALPLCHFVARASVIGPKHEYLAALGSVDPSRCLIFRSPPPGYVRPKGLNAGPGGSARIGFFSPEKVAVSVNAREKGYLLMSQTASHGWRATLDGKAVPVLKAYGFLVAVNLPAGEHKLVFTYSEPLVTAGLVMSPVAFALLVLWSLVAWLRKRSASRA